MLPRLFVVVTILFSTLAVCAGQNANTPAPTTRQRTQSKPASTPTPQNTNTQTTNAGAQSSRTRRAGAGGAGGANDATSKGVLAAFNSLIAGIEKSDVDLVTNAYWNSAQLTLFNYNGTVTRGWEQMRKNRESSYPNIKDVKLTVRDEHVLMLGRDAALLTALWTQTQTYKGTPETATGRMTLVFQRINGVWKAVHLHTSPDAPDPSRLPPSEKPSTDTTTTTPPRKP